jgi:hypothetical protein
MTGLGICNEMGVRIACPLALPFAAEFKIIGLECAAPTGLGSKMAFRSQDFVLG